MTLIKRRAWTLLTPGLRPVLKSRRPGLLGERCGRLSRDLHPEAGGGHTFLGQGVRPKVRPLRKHIPSRVWG